MDNLSVTVETVIVSSSSGCDLTVVISPEIPEAYELSVDMFEGTSAGFLIKPSSKSFSFVIAEKFPERLLPRLTARSNTACALSDIFLTRSLKSFISLSMW